MDSAINCPALVSDFHDQRQLKESKNGSFAYILAFCNSIHSLSVATTLAKNDKISLQCHLVCLPPDVLEWLRKNRIESVGNGVNACPSYIVRSGEWTQEGFIYCHTGSLIFKHQLSASSTESNVTGQFCEIISSMTI